MSFLETVEKVRAFLERNGRVSLSALRLEFDLDDAQIDALIEELVDIQQIAMREGKALAWAGSTSWSVGLKAVWYRFTSAKTTFKDHPAVPVRSSAIAARLYGIITDAKYTLPEQIRVPLRFTVLIIVRGISFS